MSCKYNGAEYSDGAEICQGTRMMRCVDGSWVPTGEDCEAMSAEAAGAKEVEEALKTNPPAAARDTD